MAYNPPGGSNKQSSTPSQPIIPGPPPTWPYNRLSAAAGERMALTSDMERAADKAKKEAAAAAAAAAAAGTNSTPGGAGGRTANSETPGHHHHHHHHHHHSIGSASALATPHSQTHSQPQSQSQNQAQRVTPGATPSSIYKTPTSFGLYNFPRDEARERERLIARERQLVKERQDREKEAAARAASAAGIGGVRPGAGVGLAKPSLSPQNSSGIPRQPQQQRPPGIDGRDRPGSASATALRSPERLTGRPTNPTTTQPQSSDPSFRDPARSAPLNPRFPFYNSGYGGYMPYSQSTQPKPSPAPGPSPASTSTPAPVTPAANTPKPPAVTATAPAASGARPMTESGGDIDAWLRSTHEARLQTERDMELTREEVRRREALAKADKKFQDEALARSVELAKQAKLDKAEKERERRMRQREAAAKAQAEAALAAKNAAAAAAAAPRERPYTYKPEPLVAPPPPAANGREYSYTPREKRSRNDSSDAVPTRGGKRRKNDPELDAAVRDWSEFTETPKVWPEVISTPVLDWLSRQPEEKKAKIRRTTYTGPGWNAACAGLTPPGSEGELLIVYISSGYLGSGVVLRGDANWSKADPAWHDVALGLSEYLDLEVDVVKPKLWGSDVYTDDSDIGSMLVHAGFVRWEEALSDEYEIKYPAKEGIEVHLRILPTLLRYTAQGKRGLQSRGWGNGHDGLSVMIEKVERATRSRSSLSGRKATRERLRELAAQRAATLQRSWHDEREALRSVHEDLTPSASVGPTNNIRVLDGEAWYAYSSDALSPWLVKESWHSIWTHSLGIKSGDSIYTLALAAGATLDRPTFLFTLPPTPEGEISYDNLGVDDVHFTPLGLAIRLDTREGELYPVDGYRWIAKTREHDFDETLRELWRLESGDVKKEVVKADVGEGAGVEKEKGKDEENEEAVTTTMKAKFGNKWVVASAVERECMREAGGVVEKVRKEVAARMKAEKERDEGEEGDDSDDDEEEEEGEGDGRG